MQIAIQERMLPGRTIMERCQQARDLGLGGIEFQADGLADRVGEVVEALEQTGLAASAVNMGRLDGYLAPAITDREAAISQLRQALATAQDLEARHVVFVPHYGELIMPDLRPYRAPVELTAEMMIWLLRTVSDLAYVFDVELDMLPVNRYETAFINRIEQAALFRQKIKNHRFIKIAAHTFHMAIEEDDPIQALSDHQRHLGYVLLADSNGRLPGQGLTDFAALAAALKAADYDGWVTLDCHQPGHMDEQAAKHLAQLPTSLEHLRAAGWVFSHTGGLYGD